MVAVASQTRHPTKKQDGHVAAVLRHTYRRAVLGGDGASDEAAENAPATTELTIPIEAMKEVDGHDYTTEVAEWRVSVGGGSGESGGIGRMGGFRVGGSELVWKRPSGRQMSSCRCDRNAIVQFPSWTAW